MKEEYYRILSKQAALGEKLHLLGADVVLVDNQVYVKEGGKFVSGPWDLNHLKIVGKEQKHICEVFHAMASHPGFDPMAGIHHNLENIEITREERKKIIAAKEEFLEDALKEEEALKFEYTSGEITEIYIDWENRYGKIQRKV